MADGVGISGVGFPGIVIPQSTLLADLLVKVEQLEAKSTALENEGTGTHTFNWFATCAVAAGVEAECASTTVTVPKTGKYLIVNYASAFLAVAQGNLAMYMKFGTKAKLNTENGQWQNNLFVNTLNNHEHLLPLVVPEYQLSAGEIGIKWYINSSAGEGHTDTNDSVRGFALLRT